MGSVPTLDELVLRWQELRQHGRPVTPEDLCADCPELLDPLRHQVKALESMAAFLDTEVPGSSPPTEGTDATLSGEPGTAPAPRIAPPGYEILGELGRGGMGVVYQARQVRLKRLVALKMIGTGAQAGPEQRERFRVEAEAAARLQHPNIVQIHEVGEHAGVPYFSLEYVDGGSLDRKLAGSPLPPRRAAELAETLARAMDYAHQRGIVHRDLKPANILLQKETTNHTKDTNQEKTKTSSRPVASGSSSSHSCHSCDSWFPCRPKITDFGLAKQLDTPSGQTQSGAIMGTPSYMAPEQARGQSHRIGPAADIYALGAILYEMLTGRPPFKGDTAWDTVAQVVADSPVPPRVLQAKVPRDLETICLKCLEKDPARRYASAGDLADDLARFLGGEPIRARPAGWIERTGKWVRRRPAAALAGLVALLLVAGAAGGYLLWQDWAEQRQQIEDRRRAEEEARAVKVEYYTSFQRRWGLPVGIGPVSPDQARRMNVVCKFSVRGGQVERVDLVNGLGRLTGTYPGGWTHIPVADSTPSAKRECSFRYRRDAQGQITEERAYDQAGRLVWQLHFTSQTTAHYQDPQGFPSPRTGSGAAYVRYVWSPNGLAREWWYLDREGRPKPNLHGRYGQRREYDERGLLCKVTFVNLQGEPTLDEFGTAGSVQKRDATGRVLARSYFGRDGRPVLDKKHGYHQSRAQYDAVGNLIGRAYFDTAGRPVLYQGNFHRWAARFDDHGNETEVAFFGTDDRPLLVKAGFHKRTMGYDERGRCVAEAYFGTDGRPMPCKSGYPRWKGTFDKAGNLTEGAFFGLDDRPVLSRNGSHRWRAQFDGRGNQTEVAYFGIDDRPVMDVAGYHRRTHRYDDRDRLIETAYFGTDGRPVALKDGYHRRTMRYDDQGNEVGRAYFGTDGAPVRVKRGYHRMERTYDGRGRLTGEAFFDTDDRPALYQGDYHRWTARLDEQGNRVEEAYFGADSRPTVVKAGYHKIAARFDGRGDRVEQAYFGLDGRPVAHRDGNHRWKGRCGDLGRLVEVAYFGTDDRPILLPANYHRWTKRFDARGNVAEVAYFGLDGFPTRHADGYHRRTERYDERGRLVETAYFGTTGKPVMDKHGNARVTRAYDRPGGRPTVQYWGLDDHGAYAARRTKLDVHGRVVESAYFTADGKPALHPNGFHRWTAKYDARGRQTEMRFFGPDGRPARHEDGSYGWVKTYDDRGRAVAVACLGPDGKQALWKRGHHRRTLRYDDRGNVIEEAYFGLDGKPVRLTTGYARLAWTYDAHDRQTDMRAFDTDGKPVALHLVVAAVMPGGRAERVGLRVGDVLTAFAGRPVASYAGFHYLRLSGPSGAEARPLEILRRGKKLTLAVTANTLDCTLESRAGPVGDAGRQTSG